MGDSHRDVLFLVVALCECRSVLWFHTSCLAHRAISHLLAILVLLSGTACKHEELCNGGINDM